MSFRAFALVLTVYLTGILAACAAEEAEPRFDGEIVIGATFPLTGEMETYGQSAYYGAATRVKLINAAGGVNGKKLVLEWRDNKSDTREAVNNVEELVRDFKVPAILGPLFSGPTLAVQPLAEKLKVVVLTPMGAIDAIVHEQPWVFRAGFSNSAQARAMSRFQLEKYGAKTCGILYEPRYAFCAELAHVFADIFQDLGGTVIDRLSFIDAEGGKDYRTPLARLAEAKPDFIFAPAYALEATEIIHAAKEMGVDIRFCGPHTWDNELVFDASGSRLDGTAIASELFEREFSYRPFRLFFSAMEEAGMDNPDAQAASAYDAVTLLAYALEKGETAEAVREGLLGVQRLPLATGRITITPEGDTLKPVIIRIIERRSGRMTPVYAERYDP